MHLNIQSATEACQEMRHLFPQTPLQRNEYLSNLYQADIYLKREDLTPVRSYKIRGAFNAMRRGLIRDPALNRFVCASAGNHAQGVAFACQYFGVTGVIFMPVTTPKQKIDKTRIFGGDMIDIHLVGDYFEETLTAAKSFSAKNAARFLPPFDDADVIEGQASVAIEMLDQSDQPIDMVILPVGGGGLSAGVTSYLTAASPDTAFRFVEPQGAKSLAAAVKSGKPVSLKAVDNFVDGAAVARIGDLNFAALADVNPDHILASPENRLCETMSQLLNLEGIVLEPAGALSVDILQDLRDQIKGKRVVCVTSGGNFDFERLPEVKERAMRFGGLKKYFLLRLPQRPGALKEFLGILGPDDDISRFEYLKKSTRNFGTVLIGIETKHKDNFSAIFDRLENSGMGYERWSQDFGPAVKMDRLMRKTIQNDKTKEPFTRLQSQGCA